MDYGSSHTLKSANFDFTVNDVDYLICCCFKKKNNTSVSPSPEPPPSLTHPVPPDTEKLYTVNFLFWGMKGEINVKRLFLFLRWIWAQPRYYFYHVGQQLVLLWEKTCWFYFSGEFNFVHAQFYWICKYGYL